MNFFGQGFQKLENYRQTDRHTTQTDATKYITTAAFVGGNNSAILWLCSVYTIMGIDHGRGDKSPRIWSGGTLMQIVPPPRFCHVAKF